MNLSEETKKLIYGTYANAVSYLINKYGVVNGSYFLTTTCASKNKKITRTCDGLVIHHVKENIAGDLSKKEQALKYPFTYQESNNLVYCNYIEHLILS